MLMLERSGRLAVLQNRSCRRDRRTARADQELSGEPEDLTGSPRSAPCGRLRPLLDREPPWVARENEMPQGWQAAAVQFLAVPSMSTGERLRPHPPRQLP